MLTKMRLLNFKSWRDLELDLAPLTILFGTNGSGKTSILQSLLLLKQTAISFDRKQHINFGGGERDYVDLGSYRELAFEHDERHLVEVQLDWYKTVLFDLDTTERAYTPKISYTIGWKQLSNKIIIEHLEYKPLDSYIPYIHAKYQADGKYTYEVPENWDLSMRFEALGEDPNTSPESCYRLTDQFVIVTDSATPNDVGVVETTFYNRYFEMLMDGILYLGPLRHYPQRAYLWTGTTAQTIGKGGENTIVTLIASERQNTSLIEEVSQWLAKMGLVSSFRVESVDRDKRFYETRIKVIGGGADSSLIDVGFGISQVLPVITMLLSAPPDSTILLEQPELHLHPSAQTYLADLFLYAAETRNLQLIVESHSEHLLRRLQRRIAEGVVTSDKIKMYFCQAGAQGSTIQPVDADSYGQILNWPNNFFGDITGDLEAMALAALKR